jgi:acetylornithine aminotransferase
MENVQRVSAHLHKRLSALPERYPSLVPSEIRGKGLILGLPLADAHLPGKVAEMCRERGVFILTCGRNTLRFVPSLIVTEKEVDKAVDVLESVLEELASQ